MQNWDTMQTTASYEQHNNWYNSMFAANIKTEPGTTSPIGHHEETSPLQSPVPTSTAASQLESYLMKHHHQQQQHQQQQQHHQIAAMDTMSAMTPSPSNTDSMQHFFDSNMQHQLLQQQQYQQQFQQAQQAAAQNQTASTHLPLGFNPLTPPGLPTAVLPSMSHFYNHATVRAGQQTPPSPQTTNAQTHLTTPMDTNEKLQSALTPRSTPPMDVTPPKSPKSATSLTSVPAAAPTDAALPLDKEHDLLSNSSEDMKYMAESEDDDNIRMPIYNSHGKMKNYKCKSCSMVAITKVSFWEHARTHMKPEKILQCPKCPFVTELKHHLEYHIRKHKNLKPFQCDKCSYTCVNKSMLNSHRKSHSSVYQYRCSDCDYATKYCHSFKLHLRKYDHKPGLVLDEEGIPNPSVVIDVYGTRRGPKSKSSSGGGGGSGSGSGGGHKRHNERSNGNSNAMLQASASDLKVPPPTSQLSAALQGFPHQMPASPAKSTSSTTSDLPMLTLSMTLQQQQQQQQQLQSNKQLQHANLQVANSPTIAPSAPTTQSPMSNLLPPLASLLQQNRNMAFFPYWNLNLQMLAAQQQAAVLAQLSPRMRETALQQIQNQHADKDGGCDSIHGGEEDEVDHDNEDDDEYDRKSVDSAMDLSQGTPTKDDQPKHHQQQQQQTPAVAINLKLQDEGHNNTPLIASSSSSRRKGRVLKLDALLQIKSASQSPEQIKEAGPTFATSDLSMPTASSPIAAAAVPLKMEDHSSADESMEVVAPPAPNANINSTASAPSGLTLSPGHNTTTTSANISSSSTASSSGNSSNSSNSSSNSNSTSNSNSNDRGERSSPIGSMYECKYCDIYFKDAVLYTIHMGYHSCDDVFKCNMCGEKCDGPVGLFVHMARNAHS